jgi:hypothetical protein
MVLGLSSGTNRGPVPHAQTPGTVPAAGLSPGSAHRDTRLEVCRKLNWFIIY